MILLKLISFFMVSFAQAADEPFLKQIHVEQSGSATMIHFDLSKEVSIDQLEVRFLRRTIEWDLGSVQLKKDKMFIDVSGAEINNVYAATHEPKGVRIRVNLNNEKTASNYHEQIRFVQNKSKVTMILDGTVAVLNHNIKELSRMYDVKSESLSAMEEHIANQSVIKVDETSTPTVMAAAGSSAASAPSESEEMLTEGKDEKEIPLANSTPKAAVTASSSLSRMVVGVIAVCMLLASVYFVGRKLNQKRTGAAFNHDSIKVVSQKYLGPKRQLTLVRVSGEYLLLGVTDHNITLIKQLSVVDDEIPDLVPQDFKTAVKKVENRDRDDVMDSQAMEVEDTFSVSSLSDVRKIFHKRKYIDETDA